MIIVAADDSIVSPTNAHSLNEACSKCELLEFPDGNHGVSWWPWKWEERAFTFINEKFNEAQIH